jgi:hypothetical protein
MAADAMAGPTGWLAALASSKVLWGVTAMTFNLSARFITMDMTPAQVAIMQHPITKRVALVCFMFSVTRDIVLAIVLAAVIAFVFDGLLNERSRLCVLPKSWVERAEAQHGQRSLLSVMPPGVPLPHGMRSWSSPYASHVPHATTALPPPPTSHHPHASSTLSPPPATTPPPPDTLRPLADADFVKDPNLYDPRPTTQTTWSALTTV